MVSSDAEWHIKRREKVIQKHPEIANLYGPFYGSIVFLVVLVAIQWCMWVNIHVQNVAYEWIGILAWINANTFFYATTTFIHENSHGFVLGWKNRLWVAVVIEMAFLSFGDQWGYTEEHYFMHHPHLNDQKRDSECPGLDHMTRYPSLFVRIMSAFLELFPGFSLVIGMIFGQQQFQTHSSKKRKKQENVLLGVTLLIYGILFYYKMWKSILFAVWTLSFYVSRWCITFHGQQVAEHYSSHNDVATKSSYGMITNLIAFNTGYHDEHHTFPNISWFYLPQIRKMSPEDFQNENHDSYLVLWLKWVWNGFDNQHYRFCK